MVKTRLLKLMGKDSLEVLQEIIWQWIGLLAQLVLVGCIAISISDIDLAFIKTIDHFLPQLCRTDVAICLTIPVGMSYKL